MPVSYEVSAIFALEDRAGAALGEIIGRLDQLDGLLTRVQEAFGRLGEAAGLTRLNEGIAGSERALGSLQSAAERVAAGISGAFGGAATRIDETVTAALGRADAAAQRLAEMDALRPQALRRTPTERPENESPAGVPAARRSVEDDSLSLGIGEIATGFGVWKSMQLAATEQQALFLATQAFGVDPGSAEGTRIMALLRQQAHEGAAGTSFSEAEVSKGMPALFRPLGLTGEAGAQQAAGIFAQAAKAAEAIQLANKGTFADTMESAVEFAHITRTYDPAKLQQQFDMIGAITLMTPHSTFSREAGVMSYVLPMARTAGIDPEEAAIATGFLQQSGLRGTIAGTTLRQMIVGLTRGGGPMQGHLAHIADRLEPDLLLSPDQKKYLRGDMHHRELQEVGFYDKAGRPQFTTGGDIDLHKVFDIFGKYISTHNKIDSLAAAYAIWGVRGQQAAELVEGARENYEKFSATVHQRTDAPGYLTTMRDQLSHTVMQQFGQALARASDLLNNLSTAVLPEFSAGLMGAVRVLEGAGFITHDNREVAAGGFAAAAGGAMKFAVDQGPRVLRFFGIGRGEPAAGPVASIVRGLGGAALRGGAAMIAEGLAEQAIGAGVNAVLGPPRFSDEQLQAAMPGLSDYWKWMTGAGANPDDIVRQRLGIGASSLGVDETGRAYTMPSGSRPGFPAPIHYGAPPKVDVQVNVTGADNDPSFAARVRASLERFFTGEFADALAHSTGAGNGTYLAPSLGGVP